MTADPIPMQGPKWLIGRYFHIFGEDREVVYQGRVLSQIDDTHYLVQFYEWLIGEANTIYVVTIDMMTAKTFDRIGGHWQFYENREHWIDWHERHPPSRTMQLQEGTQ